MDFRSLLFFFIFVAPITAQLASIYSDVSRRNDCASWSSWGPCVWPDAKQKRSYIQQLTPVCQSHWFFKFLSVRYESALDSFFTYFQSLLLDGRPCGMCSYRQSCGFGGRQKCHLSPFEIPGGRSIIPFFVSEKICNRRDLRGIDQSMSCALDYDKLMENGGECKLWPTPKVDLSAVEPSFRAQLESLSWYSCISDWATEKPSPFGAARSTRVCRCCCFPFRPNPKTLKCEHIPGAPEAPGEEQLEEDETERRSREWK
ncbi:hypothetical protein niasHT_030665 [Heterodera trifolii]|uniref:Uncharacterized protein n=1 Tax=Heterodera trifolii TaxID=157864 RepID=A0ABD2HN91_9BILA